MTPNALDHLLALVLVLFLPVYGARGYRRFVAAVRSGRPGVRLREYRKTMAMEWLVAAGCLLAWWGSGRAWVDLGFALPQGASTWIGLGGAAVGLAFLVGQWVAVCRLDAGGLARLQEQIEPVRELLPQSDAEYRAFRLLSLTAGTCEELLYRGFLVAYAATFLGLWPAVGTTSAVFGIAHWYQGRSGVLKTGLVGLLMGVLYAASGSLLWPAILHVAIDLQGGAIGHRVLGTAPAPAVVPAA